MLVWCPILTTLRWTSFTWVTCLPDTLHEMKFEVLTLDCDAVQFGSVLRSFSRSYHIYQSISVKTVDSQYFFFLFGIFGNNRISEMSVKVVRLHGVTSKKTNLIIVQQDATVFSLLYFCRQLYMFGVLTPIIRSSYSCNYSFWHWSTGSTAIRSRCWVGTCRAAYRNIINWIQSHLVGQLLNLIHDSRTYEYKTPRRQLYVPLVQWSYSYKMHTV